MPRRHEPFRPLVTALSLVLAAASGCATPWTARTATPEQQLQWPFAPHPPKLVYAGALNNRARSTRHTTNYYSNV